MSMLDAMSQASQSYLTTTPQGAGGLVGPGLTAGAGAGGILAGLGSALGNAGAALGVAGPILSGVGSLTSGILGLVMSGRQSQQSHMEQRQWERLRTPSAEYYKQLFYNPALVGRATPYGEWDDPRQAYQWSPTPAMQNLYQNYLTRTYGLPDSVARAQSSQALGPIRLGTLPSQARSPGQVGGYLNQQQAFDPTTMAQSLLGSKVPQVNRQMDYLKGAAELAGFNLWRTQQLPSLIG